MPRAHTELYGYHTKTESFVNNVTTTDNRTGAVTSSQTAFTQRVNKCGRDYHTSNKIKTIPGTSGKWRFPSDYGRFVHEFTTTKGTRRRVASYSTYEQDYYPNFLNGVGIFFPQGIWSMASYPVSDNGARNRAQVECLLKLGDAKATLGASLAEAVKTANMLADTASILARSLLAAKRGRFGEIPNILGIKRGQVLTGQSAANYWLQYTYGWLPLIGEIHGVQQLLFEQLKPPALLRAKRAPKPTQRSGEHWATSGETFRVNWNYQIGYSCQITARLSDDFLRQANRWGVANPASIAWEVVPFSFVIDWLVPVGNCLAALSATAGLTFVAGSTSYKAMGRSTATVDGSYWTEVSPGEISVDAMAQRRFRLTGFPIPLPYAVDSPFKTSRILSAISLIRQLL